VADQNCSLWQSYSGVVLDQLARTRSLGTTAFLRQVCDFGYFIRVLRAHMRFGELSRASLSLLRLQWNGHQAECDWMARPPDPWDATLPPAVRERHASSQALRDAMEIRKLLFCLLPEIESATIRAYRKAAGKQPDLIITGTMMKEDLAMPRSPSLAMQAKLCGLRFELDDGILESLPPVDLEQPYSV